MSDIERDGKAMCLYNRPDQIVRIIEILHADHRWQYACTINKNA